ncbi:hypothetical protein P7C73_g3942, partial [Tremellales sp. Uapishka_1]
MVIRLSTARSVLGDPTDTTTKGTLRATNPAGGFCTLLTSCRPGGRYTGPFHWDVGREIMSTGTADAPQQWRLFTVAERKRIQGVPDDYTLCGTVAEQNAQLGNMVCVDVAQAIYSQLAREMVLPWWLANGRPREVFKKWREAHP